MHNETELIKETQDLELVAQLIKQASFFEGTTDLDRLLNKQVLFLVAAGLKPAAEIASEHMQKVDSTRPVSVADDSRAVGDFLDGLGLVYHQFPTKDAVIVIVARTQQKLDAAIHAPNRVAYGRAMGFPETALTETGQEGMLSHEKTQQLAIEMYHDAAFANFLFFSFSQEHARDELEYAKRWYDTLSAYDLID